MLNNKVIGINTSGIDNVNNIGYATPISYYHVFKKQLFTKNNLFRMPSFGIKVQTATEQMTPKGKTGFMLDIYLKIPILLRNKSR